MLATSCSMILSHQSMIFHDLIKPIFKAGDRSSVKRYTPISLLFTISKVLERLVFNRAADILTHHMSVSQFRFLKGRSSQQQLLIMPNEVHANTWGKLALILFT